MQCVMPHTFVGIWNYPQVSIHVNVKREKLQDFVFPFSELLSWMVVYRVRHVAPNDDPHCPTNTPDVADSSLMELILVLLHPEQDSAADLPLHDRVFHSELSQFSHLVVMYVTQAPFASQSLSPVSTLLTLLRMDATTVTSCPTTTTSVTFKLPKTIHPSSGEAFLNTSVMSKLSS
jgi:hypothetical protein